MLWTQIKIKLFIVIALTIAFGTPHFYLYIHIEVYMGTLGTVLLIGGGALVLFMGYNIYKNFFTKEGQDQWTKQLRTPEGRKAVAQIQKELTDLEAPSAKAPPKAVSHAHLGRFVSYN